MAEYASGHTLGKARGGCYGASELSNSTLRIASSSASISSIRSDGGKSGLKIAHLLAQHPSRAIILRLTRLGGILFETRYRAGYDWIEILCHQPEKTPVGGVVEASDDDQPWTKLLA